MARLTLEEDIKHLEQIPAFREKVHRAFRMQKTWEKRVHWKPYGWIRFYMQPDGSWIGKVEDWTLAYKRIKEACEKIERENKKMMSSPGMPLQEAKP